MRVDLTGFPPLVLGLWESVECGMWFAVLDLAFVQCGVYGV